MPMPAKVGRRERQHNDVPYSDVDLLIAPRAQVDLARLIRLDLTDLNLVIAHGAESEKPGQTTVS